MSVVVMANSKMGCMGLGLLIARQVPISAVFTYEDDPREDAWFGSVKQLALSAHLPTFLTEDVNAPEWVERIREMKPDVIFSFYYRHMIKKPIRDIPRFGCVNLHGSLLPKYRGRAPINWQLVYGEKESGVTLHYIVREADAGDIIDQERVAIGPEDTAKDLYEHLLVAGEKALRRNLDGILTGTAPRRPQIPPLPAAFGGRRPEDGKLDWTRSAQELHNLVRAVARPWPGAFGFAADGKVMVWRSRPHPAPSTPLAAGRVRVENGRTLVGTGAGALELVEYVAPGGRVLKDGEQLDV